MAKKPVTKQENSGIRDLPATSKQEKEIKGGILPGRRKSLRARSRPLGG